MFCQIVGIVFEAWYVHSRERGFIISTDRRETDHRLTTHRPTDHQPLTHRPTNPPTQKSLTQPTRFYFKDLINEKYSFYRTQTVGKM